MGSLVGGWDSPVSRSDPKFVKFQRNSSLTKGEIEDYWKLKKKTEEDHLRATSASPDTIQETYTVTTWRYSAGCPSESQKEEGTSVGDTDKRLQTSSSLPMADTQGNLVDTKTETSLDTFIKQNAWWTRSMSAFLNEPPVIASSSSERSSSNKSYTYAPQFHVVG